MAGEVEGLGSIMSTGTASGILNGVVIIVALLAVLGVIALAGWLYYKKVYLYKQFKCVIFYRNGFGQLDQKVDDAGIFVDSRTKNKRLFLKKANVGLSADKIPYIRSSKSSTIYLLQTGLKNFQFINIDIQEPKIAMTVGEEDVNWAINAYDRQKKLFQTNKWMELLPFIAIAFVSIIILVIFIYFFKNFDVLKDVAIALKDVASELVKTRADTIIETVATNV